MYRTPRKIVQPDWRAVTRMQSQSAKSEWEGYEQRLYRRIPEAIRASNSLQHALGLREEGDPVQFKFPGPPQPQVSNQGGPALAEGMTFTTGDWREHRSKSSVDSTIDAEHEIIAVDTADLTAHKQSIPKIVIHKASPRPEDIGVREMLARRKRPRSDSPEMLVAPKRQRALESPFQVRARPPKEKTSALFPNYPLAAPPPYHKDTLEEYEVAERLTYWRSGLSQSVIDWLQHPATQSAQTHLLSLNMNILTVSEQQQNEKQHFKPWTYDRLDCFRIRLPTASGGAHTQDWLVFICVSAGLSGDGFDSNFEDYEDDDEVDDEPASPYWLMMVQTQHALPIHSGPVAEEESEGLESPCMSEVGNVRKEKTKTRLLINRVPLMHGRGILPSFAHHFFIACGYGAGAFDVVSEGELPLGSV